MPTLLLSARQTDDAQLLWRACIAAKCRSSASMAWRLRESRSPEAALEFFKEVHKRTPGGETRRGIAHAFQVRLFESPGAVARMLGNGSGVTCPDTVPFTVWAATKYLGKYREAIAGGDVDTNCAIVALSTARDGLPEDWLRQIEGLPYATLIDRPDRKLRR